MDGVSLNPKVKAANLPLERLAGNTQVTDREKLAEVSRQFEAVLLRQILSQAQKPLFQSASLPGGNSTNAIYQDMVTQQLADRISQGGSFGFAKNLEKELSVQHLKKGPVELKPLKAASAKQADLHTKAEVPRPAAVQAAPAAPTASAAPKVEKRYITVTPQPGKRI